MPQSDKPRGRKSVFKDFIAKITSSDKKIRLVVAVGLAAMVLVMFMDIPQPKTEVLRQVAGAQEMTQQEYEEHLEKKLYEMISSIAGAGRTKVMVTVGEGYEGVYATEIKKSNDIVGGGSGQGSTQNKSSLEEKFLMIDSNGVETPLMIKKLEPKIKGVVVICSGADNPIVQNMILEAVSTVLNISYSNVCVIKLSE